MRVTFFQTGSGKTYSMGTDFSTNGEAKKKKKSSKATAEAKTNFAIPDKYGIIPRAVHQILQYINDNSDEIEVKLSMSYLEVYKEEIKVGSLKFCRLLLLLLLDCLSPFFSSVVGVV